MQTPEHVLEVSQEMAFKNPHREVGAEHLVCDAIEGKCCEFDLVKAEELPHEGLSCAFEFFVVDNEKTF